MKRFIVALAIGMGLAGAALADTMQNSHNNTVLVTYADGSTARFHFNADGSYAAHMANGHVAGAYEVAGGQLCLTPNGGERACSPYDANRAVGDTWTQTIPEVGTITVTIQAGR